MSKPFIILNRDDVHSELHKFLFDSFLDDLGIDPKADEIYLELSPMDTNRKIVNQE